MSGISLFCNLPEFSRDKNPLINKEAAISGDWMKRQRALLH